MKYSSRSLKFSRVALSAIFFLGCFAFTGYVMGADKDSRVVGISAQGVLARVDRVLEYPAGKISGKIKHVYPSGKTYTVDFTGKIHRGDFLFDFYSKERGNELRVLYNLNGEDIWVYNVHSLKLFHKMSVDRFDAVLSTNFSFLDLSNADFQNNYSAKIIGRKTIKGVSCFHLELKPIFRDGAYGLLSMYVSEKDYIPLRIDYHDRDNAFFKFMSIVKVKRDGKRIVPLRYDMMDIRTGTLTIMSLLSIEEGINFDPAIFRSEELGAH